MSMEILDALGRLVRVVSNNNGPSASESQQRVRFSRRIVFGRNDLTELLKERDSVRSSIKYALERLRSECIQLAALETIIDEVEADD